MAQVKVQLRRDHLERLVARARPLTALAELLWNAVDGDASEVQVWIQHNVLGGVERIRIIDDGHGIAHSLALAAFQALGDSEKKQRRHSPKERIYHGQKGEGRFAAFALGEHVRWTSCWLEDGKPFKFAIAGTTRELGTFQVSDPEPTHEQPGTVVDIDGVFRGSERILLAEELSLQLAELFALYLRSYPEVRLRVGEYLIEPEALQQHAEDHAIEGLVTATGEAIDAKLTIIEWKHKTSGELVLCDGRGCALAIRTLPRPASARGFHFSAYLRSDHLREHQEGLDLDDLHPSLRALHERTRELIRDHFRRRAAEEVRALVDEWKEDRVYPYKGTATTPIELVERQVFDVVAANIHDYLPSFKTSAPLARRFSFEMLRSVLEQSPGALRRIVSEFLDLPPERRDELIELLDRTSLDALISASRLIIDRLDFLAGLEVILYEHEARKKTKERQQLHRLLSRNTWVFGEEFNLSVDDQSLSEVLRRHLALLGREPEDDLSPVVREDGSCGIVDLMLSRQIRLPRDDEFEHLIVELKRPAQDIDKRVVEQLESYADAVSQDDRFRSSRVKWTFIAVSSAIDPYVDRKARQTRLPRGMISETCDPNVTIWVKTWNQILDECKGRLRYFKDKLGSMVTHETGLEHLQRIYARHVPDGLTMRPSPIAL